MPDDTVPYDAPKIITVTREQFEALKLRFPDFLLVFHYGTVCCMYAEDAITATMLLRIQPYGPADAWDVGNEKNPFVYAFLDRVLTDRCQALAACGQHVLVLGRKGYRNG